jgi:hypothetical protein
MKKRHWYSVVLKYSKDGNLLFSADRKIGLRHQSDILNDRVILKTFSEFLIAKPQNADFAMV